MWDLFHSIPSLETEGLSILDEYYRLNKADPNYSLCRATWKQGEDAHTDRKFNLSDKGSMAIKRFRNNDKIVYDKRSDGIKKDSVSYKMAEGIIREINKKFELAMPEGEVNYVALHIGNINAEDINTKDLAFLDYVVLDLIADVSKSVSINMHRT